MRILNEKEFRALPEGVVFMKYVPCCPEELSVKGETWDDDFLASGIVFDILCSGSEDMVQILAKAEHDSSFSVDLDLDIKGRDGCFNEDQLFAVYEQKDIDGLIEKLKGCKGI